MTTRAINPTGVLATDHAALQAAIDASRDGDVVLMRHRNGGGQHTAWQLCPTVKEALGAAADEQTVFTLNPRGSTPQKVYLSTWNEENWAYDAPVLKATPADYTIAGSTLTWANSSLKQFDRIIVIYAASEYDFTIKLPRAGVSSTDELSLLTLLKAYSDTVSTGQIGWFAHVVELEYELLSVTKAITIRGETGDDNIPLTELQLPVQDDTTKPIREEFIDQPKSYEHAFAPYAGFMCHNSKTAKFENLKCLDGSNVIATLGPPVEVTNCNFTRTFCPINLTVDDHLAYPYVDSCAHQFRTINRTILHDLVFDNCPVAFQIWGGSTSVQNCTRTPCSNEIRLFDASSGLDVFDVDSVGALLASPDFIWTFNIPSVSAVQGYIGSLVPSIAKDAKIKHNSFDFGHSADGMDDTRWMQFCIGAGPSAGGTFDGLEISHNTLKNMKGDYSVGVSYGYPLILANGFWYEWFWGDYRPQTFKNISIGKNTFQHTNGVAGVAALNIGAVENVLFSMNTVEDAAFSDLFQGWLGDRSYVLLWTAVAGSEIKDCYFTADDWTDAEWTSNDIIYAAWEGLWEEDLYSIHNNKGREWELPGGATDIDPFITSILSDNSAPYYNDFSTSKKALGTVKPDKSKARAKYDRMMGLKHR